MMHEPKEQICEIGRRAYARQFVAANEGNISARIDENQVICTPTLTCKGFLKPDDLCIVDMNGRLLEGQKQPTSEIRLHLNVYRQRPDISSVFHSHPPHATAFAITGETIPRHALAEPELFVGNVPTAAYATPGSDEFTHSIDPFVPSANAILLANHGLVTYHTSVETAFWITEILDAYCRVLINARALGSPTALSGDQVAELARVRRQLGFDASANLSD